MNPENGTKSPTAKTTKTAKTSRKAAFPAMEIHREVKPNPDDVKRRAYEIYLGRIARGEPGTQETDWSRAESELARTRA
jgi:hypothetical protein